MNRLIEKLAEARAAIVPLEHGSYGKERQTLDHIDNLPAVAVRLAYDAQKEGTP